MATQKVYTAPTRQQFGLLKDANYGKMSREAMIEKQLELIEGALNIQKIRVIDTMTYASTPLAAAAWVASDAVSTTGITVATDTTNEVEGTACVSFTTGSSTFAADVTVRKTLSWDLTNYPNDDKRAKGYQNWQDYNYIGFVKYAGAASGATDMDIIIRDVNNNSATQNIPATDANHATKHEKVDLALADFTMSTGFDWKMVKDIAFVFTSAMGTSEAISIDEILLYQISNGYGPAYGTFIPTILGEDSVTRGMIMKLATTGSRVYGVSANDGDEEVFGIACGDGDTGDVILVQTTGPAIVEFANTASLEVGDGLGCSDDGGLYWIECAGTNADNVARFNGPFHTGDTVDQYYLGWIELKPGGTPS